MEEALAGILRESLQREADRTKAFFFCSYLLQDHLEGFWRCLAILSQAHKRHLGLFVEVADRVGDLFLLLLAFLVLPVAATSLLHVVGRVAQVLAGSPASIELLVWPLLLH